jgi:hypothetical protein
MEFIRSLRDAVRRDSRMAEDYEAPRSSVPEILRLP